MISISLAWKLTILLNSFGDNHLRAVWRLSLGLGVIPAVAVFVWRLSIDEPERFKKDSMKTARIPYLLILRRYGGRLAAISFTWLVCCGTCFGCILTLFFGPLGSSTISSRKLSFLQCWSLPAHCIFRYPVSSFRRTYFFLSIDRRQTVWYIFVHSGQQVRNLFYDHMHRFIETITALPEAPVPSALFSDGMLSSSTFSRLQWYVMDHGRLTRVCSLFYIPGKKYYS